MVQAAAARADRPSLSTWWSSFADLGHHVEVGKWVLDVIFKAFSNVELGVMANDVTVLDGPAEDFIS